MSEMDNANNNEIDLKDLMRAVLDTRQWVFVAVVLLSVAFWGLQTASNIVKPTVHSYTTRINLTFKGVEQGQYPNETDFRMSDLVSPVVLNKIYDANKLEDFISRRNFVSGFTAEPYTPDQNLILSKYAGINNNTKLSTAEIEALQKQLSDELQKASSNAVSVTFASTAADNIPGDLMVKVLRNVPAEWARHVVEDVGVTKFETEIYSDSVLDENLIGSIDYLIAFEMLLDRLSLLEENLEHIKELPNGVVATDDETGISVPDLDKAIKDIRRYRVAPLVNPVRTLGIAKNPEVVELYFRNELLELQREQQLLLEKRNNVEQTYNSYVRTETPGSDGTSASIGGGGMIPQVGQEFLDRIVEMTNSGADISYRQELNTKLLEISDELADAKSEKIRIEEILKSMTGESSSTQALRESYAEQVNEQLPAIIDSLRSYFQASVRIFEKLSSEDLGEVTQMYELADGLVDHNESGNILNFGNVRLYIIFLFLTIIAVIPVVMVKNAMKTD